MFVACLSRVVARRMGSALASTLVVYLGATIVSVIVSAVVVSMSDSIRLQFVNNIGSSPYVLRVCVCLSLPRMSAAVETTV